MIFRELEKTNSKNENNYSFVGRDQVRVGIPGRLPVPGFANATTTHYDSLSNIQHEKNENIINEPISSDIAHHNDDSGVHYHNMKQHSTGFGNNNWTCDTQTMVLIIMSIVTCLNCLFLFIILILVVHLCSKK